MTDESSDAVSLFDWAASHASARASDHAASDVSWSRSKPFIYAKIINYRLTAPSLKNVCAIKARRILLSIQLWCVLVRFAQNWINIEVSILFCIFNAKRQAHCQIQQKSTNISTAFWFIFFKSQCFKPLANLSLKLKMVNYVLGRNDDIWKAKLIPNFFLEFLACVYNYEIIYSLHFACDWCHT